MDFQKQYGTANPKDSAQWCEFGDAEFLIAPAGNIAQQQQLQENFTVEELIELDSKGYTSKAKNAREFMAKLRKISATTILLDWKNVTENDKPVTYTADKGFEYLSNYSAFMEWVAKESERIAKEAGASEEQIAKK